MEHIKLNAGDPETRATPAQIREAARHGLQVWHHGTRCRIASNCNGFITAVTDDGAIIRAWAGEFTVLTAAEPER